SCRATALDQALASILTACESDNRPARRARQARKLARMLAKVEHMTGEASTAGSRRVCSRHIGSARRTSMKLKRLLDHHTPQGVVCGGVASLIQARLSSLGEAIVAVSGCDGKK